MNHQCHIGLRFSQPAQREALSLYPCRFPNAAIQNPSRVSHQLATNGLMPSVRRRQRTSIAERRHCFATTVPLVCPKVSLRRAYSAGFSGPRVHFLGENCRAASKGEQCASKPGRVCEQRRTPPALRAWRRLARSDSRRKARRAAGRGSFLARPRAILPGMKNIIASCHTGSARR